MISINSIEGATGVSSIWLVGRIKGREVGILVDMGATNNFVGPLMVEHLQLYIFDVKAFEVIVADGERLTGDGCCKATKMQIPDLLMVPIGGAQIILGNMWLKSLGHTI